MSPDLSPEDGIQRLGIKHQYLTYRLITILHLQGQQALKTVMNQLAGQNRLDIEAVPIAVFVPLPTGAETRRRFTR